MKQQFWKVGILGGLIGAFTFILFFTFLYFVYENPFFSVKSYDFFVYMLVLLGVTVFHRWKMPDGFAGRFHFWEGARVSLLSWLVMMVFSVIFMYIFITVIAPEVVSQYATYETQQFVAAKEKWIKSFNQDGLDGEKVYEEVYKNYQKRNWINYLISQEIIQKTFIGLLLSVIIAAVIRK